MNSPVEIDIHLHDIRNFFAEPEIDPFDGETIGVSGIQQIIDYLKSRRNWRQLDVHATLTVPHSPEAEQLVPRMPAAIAAYCARHIQYAERKLLEVRIEGRRALWVGGLFLALCFALAALCEKIVGDETVFGRLLVESFIIAGWVGLWRPIELLLFEWWPYAQDVKLHDKVRRMKLVVRVEEPIG